MSDVQQLYDIVESDQLVVFTGAGFSAGLLRADGSPIPGWIALLREIRDRMTREGLTFTALSGEPSGRLLDAFFAEEFPRGEHLIEAATILRRADATRFDALVQEQLTPADPQRGDVAAEYTTKHRALLDLEPRGIVTVNVDRFHEQFLDQERLRSHWRVHDPINDEEAALAEIVMRLNEKPFLIKAHGTLGRRIVFDYPAYRDLIEKMPAYNALFGHLFAHYRMLFVGFGLSDLDFDLLIDFTVRRFGSPLQRHLTIQRMPDAAGMVVDPASREKERIRATLTAARAARLLERFGIHTLYLRPEEIVPLLVEATKQPGQRLKALIEMSTSRDLRDRREAHRGLRLLGPAGKRVAMNHIQARIRPSLAPGTGPLDEDALHQLSELTYSLGSIEPRSQNDKTLLASFLLEVAEGTSECEVVAHALSAMFSVGGHIELPRLESLKSSGKLGRLTLHSSFPASRERCDAYLEALIARVNAEAVSIRTGP